jgi:pimeloyl-ACP methyl ester carboxylesterase
MAGENISPIDRLIFPAPKASYDAHLSNLVQLPLKGNKKVPALWLGNPQAKWTIIYFHGNAMDIGHCRPWAELLQKQGYAVLAVEYPGYGISPGPPSEKNCYAAANAAYNYLRTTHGIPAEKIVLYGMSLGTGVATDLASRKPVGALILESPFLSTFRVITGVKLVSGDRFDSATKIDKVKCPLLVIHGTADRVVPYTHGTQLYDAAVNTSRKQFYKIDGGGHGNLLAKEKDNFLKTIADFLSDSKSDK